MEEFNFLFCIGSQGWLVSDIYEWDRCSQDGISTPSGMLWERLVMPQVLKNAPATFNQMAAYVMRPHRAYEPHFFDDRLVHSKSEDGLREIDLRMRHFRRCVADSGRRLTVCQIWKGASYGFSAISVLVCIVGNGIREYPEKDKAITEWPAPRHVRNLR